VRQLITIPLQDLYRLMVPSIERPEVFLGEAIG
jgi:hypothetical protein